MDSNDWTGIVDALNENGRWKYRRRGMVIDDASCGFDTVYVYDNGTDMTHGGEPGSMVMMLALAKSILGAGGVGEATTTRSELAAMGMVPGESWLDSS